MLIGQLAGFFHFRMLKVKINLLLFAPSALFNKRATKRHQTQVRGIQNVQRLQQLAMLHVLCT